MPTIGQWRRASIISNAAFNIAGSMLDLYKTDAQIQVDRARVDTMRDYNLFFESLSEDPNYEAYDTRYEEAYNQILETRMSSLTNRHAQDLFYQEYRSIAEQARHNVVTIQQRERGKKLYGDAAQGLEAALDLGYENAVDTASRLIFDLRASNIIDETKGEEIMAAFMTSLNQRHFSRAATELYSESGIHGGLEAAEEWASAQTEFSVTPEYQEQVISGIRKRYQTERIQAQNELNDQLFKEWIENPAGFIAARQEFIMNSDILDPLEGMGSKKWWMDLFSAAEKAKGAESAAAAKDTLDAIGTFFLEKANTDYVNDWAGYAQFVFSEVKRRGITDSSEVKTWLGYWGGAKGLESAYAVFKGAQLPAAETERLKIKLTEYIQAYPDTPMERLIAVAENYLEKAKRNIISEAIQRIDGSSQIQMASIGGRVMPVASTTSRIETGQSRRAQEMLQTIQAGGYAGVVDDPVNRESLESLAVALKKMYEANYGSGSIADLTIDPRDGTPLFTTSSGLHVKYVYDQKDKDEILYVLDPSTRRWVPAEERVEGKLVRTRRYIELQRRR